MRATRFGKGPTSGERATQADLTIRGRNPEHWAMQSLETTAEKQLYLEWNE